MQLVIVAAREAELAPTPPARRSHSSRREWPTLVGSYISHDMHRASRRKVIGKRLSSDRMRSAPRHRDGLEAGALVDVGGRRGRAAFDDRGVGTDDEAARYRRRREARATPLLARSRARGCMLVAERPLRPRVRAGGAPRRARRTAPPASCRDASHGRMRRLRSSAPISVNTPAAGQPPANIRLHSASNAPPRARRAPSCVVTAAPPPLPPPPPPADALAEEGA